MQTINDPVILKELIVSSVHITDQDQQILTNACLEESSISEWLDVEETTDGTGWRIFVDEDSQEFGDSNLSNYFYDLMYEANKFGCQYLVIDSDGPVYDELTKFGW